RGFSPSPRMAFDGIPWKRRVLHVPHGLPSVGLGSLRSSFAPHIFPASQLVPLSRGIIMASRFPLVVRWCLACALVACLASAAPAVEVKLARHPDYHNGRIVFSYLGDLWLMQEDGPARRMTVHKARDVHPRFSPDGKWIAFSSNRYGNYDVFLMPAEGGPAKRLTYHSANDNVVGWSRDSQRVVFSSAR